MYFHVFVLLYVCLSVCCSSAFTQMSRFAVRNPSSSCVGSMVSLLINIRRTIGDAVLLNY